jgi:hypothetical protein
VVCPPPLVPIRAAHLPQVPQGSVRVITQLKAPIDRGRGRAAQVIKAPLRERGQGSLVSAVL